MSAQIQNVNTICLLSLNFLKMKPGEQVFVNLLNAIPQGHEKALKHALYNAVATLLLLVGMAAGFGLFYILEPFVRPLIWALLLGSVLHPFKRNLAERFEIWLDHVNASSQPFLVAVVMIPIRLMDETSEFIGNVLRKYVEYLVCGCVGIIVAFLVYTFMPNVFLAVLWAVWSITGGSVLWLLNNTSPIMIVTAGILYISLLVFWSDANFLIGSYVAWFVIALCVAQSIGIFVIPIFIFFNLCFLIGFGYQVVSVFDNSEHKSYFKAVIETVNGRHGQETVLEPAVESGSEKHKVQTPTNLPGISKLKLNEQPDTELENVQESTRYIYAVIWACGVILLWRNMWVMNLLPIPIAFYLIKRFGVYFGIWSSISIHSNAFMDKCVLWLNTKQNILFPAPIKGLYKVSLVVRVKIIHGLEGAISSFSSTLVIVGLILFVFSFSTFLIFKIYAEGIHILAVGASVFNATVVHNPEFLQLLPEGWSDKMESVLNNAYIYGREGISNQLRMLMKDVEPNKAAELERHVLEFWDRVYQAWLMTNVESPAIGPKVPLSAVSASWNNFVETLQKTPDVFKMNIVTQFLTDNVETLLSLLDSVWALLKGNFNLVFHFLFAVLSVLLGGGSAVLNFLLNGIVFFTALFYLLSSSSYLYKPVDLLSNFSPNNGNKVGVAFEAAINGVFKASFKMALFYGLWTWLIHNLFQVKIIYLPSVLAALLGAVPFLGTYWASLPGVLELWLAQGQEMLALSLFVFQCLPMGFVDTAIYTEIRGGGHPYLTGLAIAGGVFCMGIQGAIFGPLLLCCLLVALNMSSNLMKESPTDSRLSALSA